MECVCGTSRAEKKRKDDVKRNTIRTLANGVAANNFAVFDCPSFSKRKHVCVFSLPLSLPSLVIKPQFSFALFGPSLRFYSTHTHTPHLFCSCPAYKKLCLHSIPFTFLLISFPFIPPFNQLQLNPTQPYTYYR